VNIRSTNVCLEGFHLDLINTEKEKIEEDDLVEVSIVAAYIDQKDRQEIFDYFLKRYQREEKKVAMGAS